MADEDQVQFDFEESLQRGSDQTQNQQPPSTLPPTMRKNYKKTVCRYWLRNLCMKGNNCSFLHQYDPGRMPICRFFAKYGVCKEPDCPYNHNSEGIKECNMFNLGFCIHGPNCLFKHVKRPPPAPTVEEAAMIGTPGYKFVPPHKRQQQDEKDDPGNDKAPESSHQSQDDANRLAPSQPPPAGIPSQSSSHPILSPPPGPPGAQNGPGDAPPPAGPPPGMVQQGPPGFSPPQQQQGPPHPNQQR